MVTRSCPPAAGPRALTLYVHGFNFGGVSTFDFRAFPAYDYAAKMAGLGQTSLVIDRLGYDSSGLPPGPRTCVGSAADVLHQIMHDNPRRFLAFVPGAPTRASVLFDLVLSASSTYAGSWLEGAGAVWAENQTLRWLAVLVGMPASAGGCFDCSPRFSPNLSIRYCSVR